MHDLKRSGNSFCLQRNTTAVGNRVHNAITVVLSSSLVPNLRSHGTWLHHCTSAYMYVAVCVHTECTQYCMGTSKLRLLKSDGELGQPVSPAIKHYASHGAVHRL